MTFSTDHKSGWKSEEKLVKYLLKWYELPSLANCKIEEIEHIRFADPLRPRTMAEHREAIPSRRLTLRAWDYWLNKQYPVGFRFKKVSRKLELRMKPHLAKHPEKTLLFSNFKECGTWDDQRPNCDIYCFPYQRSAGNYLAVHNMHAQNGYPTKYPRDNHKRFVIIRNRWTMVLQTLNNFLELIDQKYRIKNWLNASSLRL